MNYTAIIEQDDNTYMVSFPDIPEALTCGDTYEEALSNAAGALLTAFDFYFEDQRPIPEPFFSGKGESIPVPVSVWAKVLVLNAIVESGLSQSKLARLVGISKQEMQRVINLHHNTKIDRLAELMTAMGKRMDVVVN
ncbi:type II toxin-antitoxin system HicB family antitoxin [Candidatus Sororendozoicomonas aggregata]|uniref:type II toxin-antitoxin system HicB family antitoxin n=1 Tax=Candidatus Sororendozoicomonas aggregata TaxID=3073239 RepID=UPI002ED20498